MLETDYLVIGSGAVGMAFVDTLLTETDANIIIVDRYAKPGGHWNVAYPFVTLHQPSQFYGVSSKELSNGKLDQVGLNKGLFHLASGAEVSAYFDEIMRQTFLPSGRVQYFPLCNYKGDHEFESMMTGEVHKVKVNKKVIDCTHLYTSVPSTHTPSFSIDDGVNFMPINDLAKIKTAPKGFVVIGGGKTGIDACIYLMENHVNPDDITWIVSRDAWLIDRRNTQPDDQFFDTTIGNQANQLEAIAASTSVNNLFERLEEAGVFVRIDKSVKPQMFHGATVSQMELEQLRRIKNVVRLGRVKSIEKDYIILDKGTIPTSADYIHVDCSASAITNLSMTSVFQGDTIIPQTVRAYQPVFSAALIAFVEANYKDDETKNKLCQVVQLPNHDIDWIPMMSTQMNNQFAWSQDKKLKQWLRSDRLNGFNKMIQNVGREDVGKLAILKRLRDNALPAMMKLQQFASELAAEEQASMEEPQLQVRRDAFFRNRLVEVPAEEREIADGEILVKIEKFAYTANNITYAVAGDMIGYWKFFPPFGERNDGWGVIPVWGFAQVTHSNAEGIEVGERLFGYFPPATTLKMKPARLRETSFLDSAEHRSKLPAGYNIYRRVNHEPMYNPDFDRERMLLFPLHLTSFCIWDALTENNWYGAQQILVTSASSKTSTGLGYALKADKNSPKVIGITSQRNIEVVRKLGIYDECITYDDIESIDASIPTVIVDMAGNNKLMAALHTRLGDEMKHTINVGLTHWENARPQKGIISERSEFFFAPGHIQKRMKEWGRAEFDKKSGTFMMQAAAQTSKWLIFKQVDGLAELAKVHPDVCNGTLPPNEGLIVVM